MASGRILEIASAGGSTFPNINKPQLRELPVPLPQMETQRVIAHQLRSVEQKAEKEEARRKALELLFNSLLHNLMTGKLRVDDLEFGEVAEAV